MKTILGLLDEAQDNIVAALAWIQMFNAEKASTCVKKAIGLMQEIRERQVKMDADHSTGK